jgi:hypothetical protein
MPPSELTQRITAFAENQHAAKTHGWKSTSQVEQRALNLAIECNANLFFG